MSLWYGSNASVKIGKPVDAVDTTTTLEEQFTSVSSQNAVDYSTEVKELTFSGGEAGVDVLNVFSQQLKEESRPDLKTAEFTMTFEDIDMLEEFFGSAQKVDTGSYYRIDGRDPTGNREDKAILFKLTDGTNIVYIMLNNAWFTTSGEVSLAADGSAELTMESSCKIADFHTEDNIS